VDDKAASEDGEPAEQHALGVAQQLVPPVEGGLQRFLARDGRVPTGQPERILEMVGDLFDS
jgi:hypothetical protein